MLRFQYLMAPVSEGQSGISPSWSRSGEVKLFYLLVRL